MAKDGEINIHDIPPPRDDGEWPEVYLYVERKAVPGETPADLAAEQVRLAKEFGDAVKDLDLDCPPVTPDDVTIRIKDEEE